MFKELDFRELKHVEGGLEYGDIFEKINPIELGKCIYKAGEKFGESGVKFGRSLYHFYDDVKTLLKK